MRIEPLVEYDPSYESYLAEFLSEFISAVGGALKTEGTA